MKFKKLLSLGLVAFSLVASFPTVGVFAQTIDVTGQTGSGSANTDFSVTADMLGGGLVVTIPDSVTLSYDQENDEFVKETTVNAKGYVEVDKKLSVSVPTDITYTLQGFDMFTADGTVTFGTTDGDNQVSEWSQVELKTKAADELVGVNKALTVTVDGDEIQDIGTYEAVLNFSIELVNN